MNSLHQLGRMAPSGSLVYIHYSGHGGRAKTLFPQVKGEDGVDEGLVPTDIGTPHGQYVRDLEIAEILQNFESKGLVVTLVLDCCHSGGATRGEEVGIRGIESIDDKPLLPGQELIAPLETPRFYLEIFVSGRNPQPESRRCTGSPGFVWCWRPVVRTNRPMSIPLTAKTKTKTAH